MAGVQTAGVIDVHAHVVLAETFGAAGTLGPEMGGQDGDAPWFRVGEYRLDGVRYAGSAFMDPALRLARMATAGIDFQVLSPNPLTYLHHVPAAVAIRFCRIHNDALACQVAAYPERLAGLAALPMQDIGAAVEEFHRAVGDLGLWGAAIGTDMPHRLDDAGMDRLYDACVSRDVPLFLHPGPAGIDGPAGDPNLKDYDLDVVIGFAAQETLAVARLIFGGVLDRHPALDICLSHGGGSTAFLAGRMAQAMRKRPWSPPDHRKDGAFEERLARLWFDNHLNRAESLSLLTDLVGEDRLVFGTNFAGWDAPEDLGTHTPPAHLADNARRLLRRP
ncbi:amidohydrolase family protein [Pararhodobacter marinus]|uniref:Amidohydrolase n=1 Tax=Pararhodobacter marinus TaxID=2184063 RepID=A0A2U2C719_9RHOB|nr:amidohydrolase family protein [Pararhodobacter marinus]PWE27639.1 amidohydrolase [Pararhodobacter marinus]